MYKEWENYKKGRWNEEINVRDFIQNNYTPYEGNSDFLEGPSEDTLKLWNEVKDLFELEIKKGLLDADTKIIAGINNHEAGYLDKNLEKIVGFQTDKPLKRAIMPFGGIRVVENALNSYGYELDKDVENIFHTVRKTHNDGVFDAYTEDMRKARSSGIITGLPDAYGRGRIIGDYRRVALYGIDKLIEDKKEQKKQLDRDFMEEEIDRKSVV